ncbi:hypothetical protein SAMN05444359_112109 [Neolewinella agarilytica]|uniref:Uncharacterized protein n=1 Tax=Neolewinella agarilytica TaxID=478744 RepID=A0A1H9HD15_9BACT|nr:hypothetical protein SAMN05444359_112109 [Neolewinella agarilytica]
MFKSECPIAAHSDSGPYTYVWTDSLGSECPIAAHSDSGRGWKGEEVNIPGRNALSRHTVTPGSVKIWAIKKQVGMPYRGTQ